MSTYLNGVTDQLPEIAPFAPDYSFLTKVASTQQQRYDRGFEQVRSLYTSLLNKPLMNRENQRYRSEWFRKAQAAIGSITEANLTDPSNVAKARAIFKPLTTDEELVYDMNLTSQYQKALQLADAYQNSSDPEQRARYSDTAREYIQNGMSDLASAKRGDGSIFRQQSREFVPFEDVNKYLEDAAGKAKLQFKRSYINGMYNVEVTNGEGAISSFTNWAKSTMDGRFDRQFRIQATVAQERAVRSEMMKDPAISKSEAMRRVAETYIPQFRQSFVREYNELKKGLDDTDIRIAKLKKAYPNGIPDGAGDKVKQTWEQLQQIRPALDEKVQQVYRASTEFNNDPHGVISRGLEGMLTEELKTRSASAWGTARAMATAEQTMKPDEVRLTQFREQQNNMRQAAQIRSTQQIAQLHEQGEWGRLKYKTGMDYQMEQMKLQGKNGTPGGTVIGTSVSGDQTDITPVDTYHQITGRMLGNLKDQAFGAGGFMEYIMNDDASRNKMPAYQGAVNKLYRLSQGEQVQLDQRDQTMLGELFGKVSLHNGKHEFNAPATAADARAELSELISNGYLEAGRQLDMDLSDKKATMTEETSKAMKKAWETTGSMLRKYAQADESFQSAARGLFTDAAGNVKDDWTGKVKVVGSQNGQPVLDVDMSDKTVKNILGSRLPAEYTQQSRVNGHIVEFKGLKDGDVFQLVNAANSQAPGTGIKGIAPGMTQMNPEDLADYFGRNATVTFDPAHQTATVRLFKSADSKMNKEDGDTKKFSTQKPVEITLPYSAMRNMPLFAQARPKTEFNFSTGNLETRNLPSWLESETMGGSGLTHTSEILSDPYQTIEAPSWMQANGMNYNLRFMNDTDGTPGFQLDFNLTNADGTTSQRRLPFVPANTGDIEATLSKIDNTIDQIYDGWMPIRKSQEAKK